MDQPPINLNTSPIEVRHCDLMRLAHSVYASFCPVCEQGVLPVRRDRKTMELENVDICLYCGQRFVYIDIERLRQIESGHILNKIMGTPNDNDGLKEISAKLAPALTVGMTGTLPPYCDPALGYPLGLAAAQLEGDYVELDAMVIAVMTAKLAFDVMAKSAYEAYSKEVGGKSYKGDALPTWEAMVADTSKRGIVAGWRAAANAAVSAFFVGTLKIAGNAHRPRK